MDDKPKRERRDVSIEPYAAPIARTGRQFDLPQTAPIKRAPGSHPVFGDLPTAAELDEHLLANIRAVCYADVAPSYSMIAARIGVSEGTLRRWLDEYPRLEGAIAEWRADGMAAIRRRAYDVAMEGNPALLKFLLEARDPDFRPDTRRDGFSGGGDDDGGDMPDASFL